MIRAADDGVDRGIWECLRCGEGVRHADRWAGDVPTEDGSEWDGDGLSSSFSEFESGTDLSASGSLGYSISEYGTD